jgi:hypothetical protein
VRRLLAAVVRRAVRDVTSGHVAPNHRETAQQFLADEEGIFWLQSLARVPAVTAREFVQENCQWMG